MNDLREKLSNWTEDSQFDQEASGSKKEEVEEQETEKSEEEGESEDKEDEPESVEEMPKKRKKRKQTPTQNKKAKAPRKNRPVRNTLEELYGDGPAKIEYRGNEEVPLSRERIAIPQGLLPKIVMKEVKPEDISRMISSKRVGPKILRPVLNYGSEFGYGWSF